MAIWTEPGAWLAKALLIAGGIGASAASYGALQALWRNEEARFVWQLLRRRSA
jgi:hypothetical protein